MRAPLTAPAEAYAPDADRADPDASAQLPEWLVHFLALLILFLQKHLLALRPRRSIRFTPWFHDRLDLPPGSAEEEAATIRGPFGNAIAWMCRRRGIGPGHPDWPELSRAIVAFGGSVKGFRAGMPARGLQWWDDPNAMPSMTGEIAATPAAAAMAALLAQHAAADTPPPLPHVAPNGAAHARFPASRLPASWRQVFARAGPGLPTGPLLPGLAAWDRQPFHA
jgi:hypothetical protein